MRRRNTWVDQIVGQIVGLVAGLGAASSLALTSCDDTSLGQDQEPDGPLLVTRVTLLDRTSRDNPVFTDTSAPSNCPPMSTAPECNTAFRDMFSPAKSPPTPDSASPFSTPINMPTNNPDSAYADGIHTVFNKIPLHWNGMELDQPIKN